MVRQAHALFGWGHLCNCELLNRLLGAYVPALLVQVNGASDCNGGTLGSFNLDRLEGGYGR